jgi:polyketide biosynthesis acyl carrier protein
MERAGVVAVIVKHLRLNVDGLDDEPIDTTRSMLELGASSLDAVEVVMASMQELKVKVPRSRLSGLKNIDQLADLFCGAQPPSA